MSALEEAIKQLRRAVEDAGSHPDFHYRMIERTKEEWPTLWYAVSAVLEASLGESR